LSSEILAHLSAFNDPREGVRLFAARKLGAHGPAVAPLLIDLLQEKGGFTQDCAAVALQAMGPAAIPFLVEALQYSSRTIRWNAAAILSNMGEDARKAMDEAPVEAAFATHSSAVAF